MGIRRRALLILSLWLSACGDANDRQFYGPGLNLYSSETPKATNDLLAYLSELCQQSGIVERQGDRYGCPSTFLKEYYPILVQTGFNDIDRRCDAYLGWIDQKRTEALMYKSGLGATQGLLSTVLPLSGASRDTLAYVMGAFGFASSIYDAANISMLAALESSTIKTLVYKRQKAFRAAAAGSPARTQAQAIFALQNYLLICTPQTIVLDANTFSRDPEAGSAEAIEQDLREQFRSLGSTPPTLAADAPVNVRAPIPPSSLPINCPECEKLFVQGFADVTTKADVEVTQLRLCVRPDGLVADHTTAAVRIFEEAIRDNEGVEPDNRLSVSEFELLTDRGCSDAADRANYRNFYEKIRSDAGYKDVIDALNRKLGLTGTASEIQPTAKLNDIREYIAAARGPDVCNQPLHAPAVDGNAMGQLTRDLVNCLRTEAADQNP